MISISFSFRYAPIEGRNAVVIDVPCELIDGGKKMLFSPLSSDLPNQRSCSESFRRTEANKSIVPHGSRTPRMSRLPTCSSTSFCESRSLSWCWGSKRAHDARCVTRWAGRDELRHSHNQYCSNRGAPHPTCSGVPRRPGAASACCVVVAVVPGRGRRVRREGSPPVGTV